MRKVQTLVDSHLVLHASDLPNESHRQIKDMFTRANPKYFKQKAMGFWMGDTPSEITSWTREGMFYILPRGARGKVEELLAVYDCILDPVKDKTTYLEPANFKLTKRSVLRPYQEKAVDALIENGGGTIRGPCGSGKALSNTEEVILSNRRIITIDQVKVGDKVAGTDGGFHMVTGVYPQGVRELYRINFTDGSHTDCDGEHIWTLVKRRNNPKSHGWKSVDLTVSELLTKSLRSKGGRNFYLPEIEPLEMGKRILPIDPYLMGALLGDGHLSIEDRVQFTTEDDEIFEYMKLPKFHRFAKLKHQPNSGNATTYSLARSYEDNHSGISILTWLRNLELMGTNSHTKFIPMRYEVSCIADRLDLLQGLFDTDGTPTQSGTVEYSTVSPHLAEGVRRITRSLGGTCTVYPRGVEFPSFRVNVKLPKGMKSFRLKRKQNKIDQVKRQREPYRAIDSIEKIGKGKATCISVDSPDRLFLTGQYIPTHNTVVLIGAIARLNQPALVVVHSKLLAQQWRGAVNAWLGFQPGSIEGGKKKIIRPVTIATQQALWALISKGDLDWTRFFGTFVGDEIHRWAAKTFQAVTSSVSSRYRIGASADERRKDGMEHLIYETFSEPVYKIKKKELIELGSLLPTRMEIVKTDFFDEVYQASLDNREIPDWVSLVSRITLDQDRNDLILLHVSRVIYFSSLLHVSFKRNLKDLLNTYIHPPTFFNKNSILGKSLYPSSKNKRNGGPLYNVGEPENGPYCKQPRVLLLTDRVPAAKKWVERLRKFHIPAGLMIGGSKNKEELFDTVNGLKSGNILVGVGTSVADEGLDIPPLTHVFVTCPVHKHPKRLEQMIGRSARCFKGKENGTCVYFWDGRQFPYRNPKDSDMKFESKEKSFLRKLGKSVNEHGLFTS